MSEAPDIERSRSLKEFRPSKRFRKEASRSHGNGSGLDGSGPEPVSWGDTMSSLAKASSMERRKCLPSLASTQPCGRVWRTKKPVVSQLKDPEIRKVCDARGIIIPNDRHKWQGDVDISSKDS